jgi:hypothetical protein
VIFLLFQRQIVQGGLMTDSATQGHLAIFIDN